MPEHEHALLIEQRLWVIAIIHGKCCTQLSGYVKEQHSFPGVALQAQLPYIKS
jgi:hypothetical protein